jgi:hypothetical protein
MLIVLVYMAEVCDPTLLSYTFVCCNLRCFVGGGSAADDGCDQGSTPGCAGTIRVRGLG